MNRRPAASIVANPVLVGAVTTLVVIVAVFLAYNANNGLPFVPTRQLKVQISNGANLVKGNEVRSGGFRIGVVQDMKPVQLPNGKVGAQLDLKLDTKIGAVPVDSTVVIRPRSALGLKYVELTTGASEKTIPDGGLLPATHAVVPVELDEFYNMFDAKTRAASQQDLKEFGDAFAGRGYDLNRFITVANPLFLHLERVMRNLSAPRTHLQDFFKELGDTVRVIAPVSKTNAHLFTTMADTFDAIGSDPKALRDTITKNPPTLAVSTASLKAQRPFLRDFASFSEDLAPATTELRGALPPLNRALKIGIPVTARSVKFNDDLQAALAKLQELADAPTTSGSLRGLGGTVNTLQPTLRYLGPYITVCNYFNSFWTFTAEHFTAADSTGGSERALLNNGDNGPDNVSSMGANEFVHGVPGNGPNRNGGRPQYTHGNTFGNEAIKPDGRANCQIGQQGYLQRANKYSPNQAVYGQDVVDTPTDADIPAHANDAIGPTYAHYDLEGHGFGLNPSRVPPGETFTNQPGGLGVNP
jgi:virulence factor Mce-like protein